MKWKEVTIQRMAEVLATLSKEGRRSLPRRREKAMEVVRTAFTEEVERYVQRELLPAAAGKARAGKRKLRVLLIADQVPNLPDEVAERLHYILGGVGRPSGKSEFVDHLVWVLEKMNMRVKCKGFPAIGEEGQQTWIWVLKIRW